MLRDILTLGPEMPTNTTMYAIGLCDWLRTVWNWELVQCSQPTREENEKPSTRTESEERSEHGSNPPVGRVSKWSWARPAMPFRGCSGWATTIRGCLTCLGRQFRGKWPGCRWLLTSLGPDTTPTWEGVAGRSPGSHEIVDDGQAAARAARQETEAVNKQRMRRR